MLYEFDELENMAELIIEDINSDDDDDFEEA
jgi:hypothetical protein